MKRPEFDRRIEYTAYMLLLVVALFVILLGQAKGQSKVVRSVGYKSTPTAVDPLPTPQHLKQRLRYQVVQVP